MVVADRFPPSALDLVARQLSRFVALTPTLATQAEALEVSPPLGVWSLHVDLFLAFGSLATAAYFSGRWHHQIRRAGRAVAHARSMLAPDRRDHVDVREVCESPLAERLDHSLAFVRSQSSDEPALRLLSLPSLSYHLLWVHPMDDARSRVVVLTAPDDALVFGDRFYRDSDLRNVLHRHVGRSSAMSVSPVRPFEDIGWREKDVLKDPSRPPREVDADRDVLAHRSERPRGEEVSAA